MIVADAGPIIAVARIGRLDLLRRVVRELVIPDAVYDDLVVKGKGWPGAQEVDRGEWIRRNAIQDQRALAQPSELGRGEREAIVLAREQRAVLEDAEREYWETHELSDELYNAQEIKRLTVEHRALIQKLRGGTAGVRRHRPSQSRATRG